MGEGCALEAIHFRCSTYGATKLPNLAEDILLPVSLDDRVPSAGLKCFILIWNIFWPFASLFSWTLFLKKTQIEIGPAIWLLKLKCAIFWRFKFELMTLTNVTYVNWSIFIYVSRIRAYILMIKVVIAKHFDHARNAQHVRQYAYLSGKL